MSVERIEQYKDTLKVILKPTKKFPEGRNYFYCDSEDIDLVQSHSWHLEQGNTNICVRAINSFRISYRFHRELAYKYLGYYPEEIEHINGLEFDNVDCNLNTVTRQQNLYNKTKKGYIFIERSKSFQVSVRQKYAGVVHTEIEACQLAYLVDTDYFKELMKSDYYMYNFLLDRRNDLDILDDERTGKISEEEAVYRHVVRHAKSNAWFYYRYNLAEYFKDNSIPIPDYDLDEQGFMVDKITRKRLCPFN